MTENRNALPKGEILGSLYRIERLIGGGGFGLVYEVKHVNLGAKYAIKELFPRDLVVRQGTFVNLSSDFDKDAHKKILEHFRKEGRRLIELDACEHIVRCRDYFEENNTGCLVVNYAEGESLESKVESYKEKGYSFSRKEIAVLLKGLLTDLKKYIN